MKNVDPQELAALRGALRQVLEAHDRDVSRVSHLASLAALPELSSKLQHSLIKMVAANELPPRALSRLLRQAGYSAHLVSLVERLLVRFAEDADSASDVSSKDLKTLIDQADPTLIALQRARQRKTPEEALQGSITALLRGYGKSADDGAEDELQKSLVKALSSNELSPSTLSRLLRQAGYSANLASFVERLLVRFAEDADNASDVSTKDLITLIDQADPTLVALQRARQQTTPEEALTANELSPRTLSRLLRHAGYSANLASFVERVLVRFAEDAESASDVSAKDLMTLLDQADPTLIAVQRARQRSTPEEALQASITALLRGYGENATASADLAVGVCRSQAKGLFREFARIGRAAQSAEDSCVSMADVNWRNDERFDTAYREAKTISAWGREITWRVQTLTKMAHLASQKEGHFVECGVDTGGTAMAVMAYLGDKAFEGRKFYLFDTFKGLEKSQLTEEEMQTSLIKEARYPNVLEQVQATFANKTYAEIVPGPVPDTLAEYQGGPVAYLHIDMNVAHPEVEALRFFWPKLSPGAPVIFDDYGFPHHEPQRRALDALAAEFGSEIMMLPTCQGLLFKS